MGPSYLLMIYFIN